MYYLKLNVQRLTVLIIFGGRYFISFPDKPTISLLKNYNFFLNF